MIDVLEVIHDGDGAGLEPLGPPGADREWLRASCREVKRVVPGRSAGKLRFGFIRDAAEIRREVRRSLDRHYDAVWGHSACWPLFLPECVLAKTVLDVQDCYDLSYRRQLALQPAMLRRAKLMVKRWQYRTCVRRHMRSVAAVVMVNEADVASIRHLAPGLRVEVVDNGVDCQHYARPEEWTQQRQGETIVFTGVMSAGHNVQAALFFADKVLPLVRDTIPTAQLLVVGKSPADRVLRMARQTPGMVVVADVPDLRPYLWPATVYVAPMVSGTGIKNKVLEAWAAGCAVVATSLGCEALAAREGENILIADDPASMASKVVRLLNDEALRCRLGTEAVRTARHEYGWAKRARRFEELLWSAARGTPGVPETTQCV